MKKVITIFFLILSLSVIFSFTSSGAKAGSLGDAKKGLDSILRLTAPGPQGKEDIPREGINHEPNPLPEFRIPLGSNLKAFLGIAPSSSDSPLDSGSDTRAAFGFRIPLK